MKPIEEKLLHATLYDKPEIITELYKSMQIDTKKGEQALVNAAQYNSKKVAELLLKEGISPLCYITTNLSCLNV